MLWYWLETKNNGVLCLGEYGWSSKIHTPMGPQVRPVNQADREVWYIGTEDRFAEDKCHAFNANSWRVQTYEV